MALFYPFFVGESGQADLKAEHVCPGTILSYRGVIAESMS